MMNSKKCVLIFLSLLLSFNFAQATDMGQVVSGADVENSLEKMSPPKETNEYLIQSSDTGDIANQKISKKALPDFNFTVEPQDLSVKNEEKRKLEDSGYTTPGTYENSQNYIELDKKGMAESFRKHSAGALNLTYIQNNYDYQSDNDIINRTISQGYKHIKGGALYVRSDQYILRRDYMNPYWSLGVGLGYNSGRGIFITGDQSNATFRLYEIPIDAGIGVEIPLYHWFKISGTAGPSVTGLLQNRSDLQQGEKGRNKIQISYGEFANAQFKFNLSGLSDNLAYDLFTQSKITNLLLNLEVRYQNYQNFQDAIKISGTSFGIGFTFEYL